MRSVCRLLYPLNKTSFIQRACVSSGVPSKSHGNESEEVSDALKKYLGETKQHDFMIEKQRRYYEEGIQNLAAMMDEDPATFSEEKIKETVSYLFPSSLHSPRARPKLIPPEDAFPDQKSLQCSLDGRPLHSLFYTRKPNYYGILNKAAALLYKLEEEEDAQVRRRNIRNQNLPKLKLENSDWMTLKAFQKQTLEKLDEKDYHQLMVLFKRLVDHPYSFLAEDFIKQFRVQRMIKETEDDLPQLMTDEATGRQYVMSYGQKKRAFANVCLWKEGTGKITVNGDRLLDGFPHIGDREQILFPLIFTNQLGEVDIEIRVEGNGHSSCAASCRLAISRALSCFVGSDITEKMRIAGLLTNDLRFKEKKKGGLHKARKRFIWKRR